MRLVCGWIRANWCVPVAKDGTVLPEAIVGVPSDKPPHTVNLAMPFRVEDVHTIGAAMMALAAPPTEVADDPSSPGRRATPSHVVVDGVKCVSLMQAMNQIQMRDTGPLDVAPDASSVGYDTVLHAAAAAAHHLASRDTTAHAADSVAATKLAEERARGSGSATEGPTQVSFAVPPPQSVGLTPLDRSFLPHTHHHHHHHHHHHSHRQQRIVTDANLPPEAVLDKVGEIARLREVVRELQAQARAVAEAVESARARAAMENEERAQEVELLMENNERLVELLTSVQQARSQESWNLLYGGGT